MGIFTDGQDTFEKQRKQVIEEEAQIHEQYCLNLLRKHLLDPDHHRAEMASSTTAFQYLETLGYKLERYVTDITNNSEIYEWRLYKMVDTSPKYRLKRVISVVEADTAGNDLLTTDHKANKDVVHAPSSPPEKNKL